MKSPKRMQETQRTLVYTITYTTLVILACFTLYTLFPKSKTFCRADKELTVTTFSDRETGGDSEVALNSEDSSKLSFSYTLGTTIRDPYAGGGLYVADTNAFIDLSGCDKIKLNIDSKKTDNARVTLQFHIPGFSNIKDGLSQYYLTTDLIVQKGIQEYELNFDDLITPDWWFLENRVNRSTFPKVDLSRCTGITFSNHHLSARGKEYRFTLNEVSFIRTEHELAAIFGGIFLVLLLFLITYRILVKQKEVYIPYEKVSVTNVENKDLEKLIQFLNSNYHRIDLNQTLTVEQTNLKVREIRSLLQGHFGKSFKQYITDIRLAEAKRLILESNYKISSIAETIGYPHTSTFNHLFKEKTGLSPVEFKKQQKASVYSKAN